MQFTGYEKDEESGLSNAGARMYDSKTDIFYSTEPRWQDYPWISSYAHSLNNPITYSDPDGRNPRNPSTGKEISMNLYCAAVYDDYAGKQITPVPDKSLLKSATPYNYYSQRKFAQPDGMWEGAWHNERGYNLSNLSADATSTLSALFPEKSYIDAAAKTPDDYKWMRMADQGSYVFVDNAWDESMWMHSTTTSFNIMTVTENRITQIVNLTRGSSKEKYNINSITTFDIIVGGIQSRQKRTWWGGTKTEQYRTLNITETIQNNQSNGNKTVKTYQTEEIVK
jgi:RHS repeat-associated protein